MKTGLYIAGSGKDAGKTTISLGLVSNFIEQFPGKVAFMKPLGQKSTIVDGSTVSQDSHLLENALGLDMAIRYSAPFSTSSGAAEKFITTGEPADLRKKVYKAYKYLHSHYKMVVVEGTGHPGVGSVFNLSNAEVASLYDIPVILVLGGGIGSTIDRFSMSVAPFEKAGVRILGVIINKILPAKEEKVKRILSKWFEGKGIPIFGFIPYHTSLSNPSLGVLSREMGAETLFMKKESNLDHISGFITAFGSTEEVLKSLHNNPYSALVVSEGRKNVIDSIIARKLSGIMDGSPSALILCGNSKTDPWIINACKKASLPLLKAEGPFEKTVRKIQHKVFKVEPEESQKIEEIIRLVKEKVDMEMIYKSMISPAPVKELGEEGIINKILRTPFKMLGRFISKK
ncbi:MAG: AAA family ATPase [Acidobacteriota bacterium]